MASIRFNDIYIKNCYSLVGPLECNGKLKKYDAKMNDYYFGEKTFEQAETKMQRVVLDGLINKSNLFYKDINIIIGGDLLNQLSASSYALEDFNIPFLGLYAACATFPESLIVGAMFLKEKTMKNIITITSSHNLSAEKQFRNPIEYGCPKPNTATFTATGSVAIHLCKDKTNLKIESATIGKVINMGITDANMMGAVMTPAAADTLVTHLNDLKRNVDYYDLILTGDLGCVGEKILKEYCQLNYDLNLKNLKDSGCELYSEHQDTYSGGSGPVCLPLVLFNRILTTKKYKKILIIGTGSLHNVTLLNQHREIPAIAHAVSLEVIE